ncbi:fumarylacetoacetate hydrolase family protein [Dasania marina]|uniref:fumarylacetoacetate hydrolase family protein n=1 Tax=Dasania marina TaxID=471499 RepID=UPI0030DAD8A9|tara:strand:+ start:24686 stop:25576 length:891 start_codon:yes stop_codon:yes gene_type:complete
MKFVTLASGQLAALVDEQVIDIAAAALALGQAAPASTLAQLVALGDEAAKQVWAIATTAAAQQLACQSYEQADIIAPFPTPARNIMCLGKNYAGHLIEVALKTNTSTDLPEYPIIFTKAPSCVIGPGDTIPASEQYTQKLDYEAELAIIIGKGGRDISAANAWQHVFGYTAFNDVTARDLQKNHKQFFKAKSLDGFGPMGPVVVHHSVMPSPDQITVKCTINGEVRQQDTLDHLIFDIPTMIETLSAGMTLQPGDIIATGTPEGVGMGSTPPRYLKAGDEVVVEITGVKPLINTVA